MSLVARYLEENGLPTVIIGSALDIVERCGVPRYLHVDFPLGNPCGKPWDQDMQLRIVRQGLSLLHSAISPANTVYSKEVWGRDAWREQYMEVNAQNRAELALKGEQLRADRAVRERRTD